MIIRQCQLSSTLSFSILRLFLALRRVKEKNANKTSHKIIPLLFICISCQCFVDAAQVQNESKVFSKSTETIGAGNTFWSPVQLATAQVYRLWYNRLSGIRLVRGVVEAGPVVEMIRKNRLLRKVCRRVRRKISQWYSCR